MKKFLLHITLFALLLYVLAFAADCYISKQLQALQSSPFANWNDLYQGNIQSDVLIMGSSRAFVQFNTRIIDSCLQVNSYNLGANGRPADAQILKYNIYRQQGNAKPKVILYEIYPGTLDTSNGYERIQYIPYLKRPSLWLKTRKLEHFNWADCFIPCYRFLKYKEDIKHILKKDSYYTRAQNKLYKGYQDFDKKWDGKAYANLDSIEYPQNANTQKLFEDFLTQCKREGINVVLVKAPFYIGATHKIKDLEKINLRYEDIARRHSLIMLDYTYDSLCYDTTKFYNATHLNRAGATRFSEKLSADLQPIIK